MNIAIFSDSYYPRINGVTISVCNYADSLFKLGHNVTIFCPEYESEEKIHFLRKCHFDNAEHQLEGVKVFRVPADKNPFSKEDRAGRLDQWHQVKKALDEFKPDVIHLNTEFFVCYHGLNYARHRHIPMVYTFHTMWEDYFENYAKYVPSFLTRKVGRELVKFYLKKVKQIVVPTVRVQKVVERYGIEKPTTVLPTGIPNSVVNADAAESKKFFLELQEEFPVIKGKRILLYTGRVVIEKNLYFLYDVFEKVVEKYPNTVLMFVGGGPELEPLQKKAKKLSCGNNVVFAGYRPREQLKYFYKNSDLFVFPSVTETQGLVTIEAMMCGLPVVAIGEMGTVDVMQGDNGGFMVKNSEEEFTKAVLALFDSKELMDSKKKEALEWSQQFDIDNLALKLENVYKAAINDSKN